MKVFCVGRNYADHAKELNNQVPEEPIIFLKPDTALLINNNPFYYPEFSSEIHYEVELLLRINRVGKCIHERFAHKYYEQIGIGIDFTARDLQTKLKEKGLPWDLAKGFNGAAPVSGFVDKAGYDLNNLSFSLHKNGVKVQEGNTKDMLFDCNRLIAYISRFFTLKKGDIIFTGTPAGVGPIKIGDQLDAYIENKKMLEVAVR